MKLKLLGGIDFLEVNMPGPINPDVFELMNSKKLGTNNTQSCYERMIDLQEIGYPLVYHDNNRWNGRGKLQVKSIGEMGFAEVLIALAWVHEGNPLELEIMRLDVRVDVDYPVGYFKEHARIPYKRNKGEFACLKHKESNAKQVETLEIGKRPSLWRFYDKVAERKHKYKVLCAQMKKAGKAVVPFEELYGHSKSGVVLTRVERQFGGRGIPEEVSNMEKLICNADSFKPFEGIDFLEATKKPVASVDVPLRKRIVGTWLADEVQKVGRQELESIIRKSEGSNAYRFFKEFGHYMSTSPLEPPDLNGMFQAEFHKQLNS
jgi:hypothetical protein